jgi:hypothetical protein
MGFHVQLHILYPRFDGPADPAGMSWEPYETISLGRVTRAEKLTDVERFGHLAWDSHVRAGIGVVSLWMAQAYVRLDGEGFRATLAPPFRTRLPCFDGAEEFLVDGAEPYVEAVPVGAYEPVAPVANLKEHNRLLACNDTDLREHLRLNLIILYPPFIWVDCADLAEWLTAAESRCEAEWRELEKDRISLALVRAWQTYLSHVGSVGARALFHFR